MLKEVISDFINRAIIKHQNEYSYDKSVYVNSKTKLIITCSKHGDFLQLPSNHLNGNGCPHCAIEKRAEKLSLNCKISFVNKAMFVHNNEYNYDKSVYINSKIKVTISCFKHGDFEQTPSNHLRGQGCPKCAKNIKSSEKEFILESNLVHNKIYGYDEVVYVNCDTKVKIECKIHGYFYQTPFNHLRGHRCPKCVGKNKNTPMFIDEANFVHKFKYLYDKTVYVNCKTKLTITCKTHGDFLQLPTNHLRGHGCPDCGKGCKRKKNNEYINAVNLVHNFKYSYNKLNYKNSKIKITITCPIHGDFEQTPNNHLKGHGCPKCKLSKGEKQIFRVLENLKIEFKTQFKFDDCIYKRKLLFDFAIFINEKIGLIEFHGEQHFKEVPYFQNKENKNKFNEMKVRDVIKQKYAEDNGINILIIDFNQIDKIEELINDFIEKVKNKI